ncbi:hypothetical protein QTP88_018183 [Uroleucon formosanum]
MIEARRKKDFLVVLLATIPYQNRAETKKKKTPRAGRFFPCLWQLAKLQKLLTSRFNSMFLKTFSGLSTFPSFIGHGKLYLAKLSMFSTETFVPETFSTPYYHRIFIES